MHPLGFKGPVSLEYRLVRKILAPFGPIVEAIGLLLCRHGPQTSSNLTVLTGFPSKRVKESLLILYHHKLIVSSSGNHDKNVLVNGNGPAHGTTKQLYTLSLPNLYRRLFFALWLMYLKNHFNASDDLVLPSVEVNLMSNVFLHTIISISNLQAELKIDYSLESIDNALKKLFSEGFLVNTSQVSQNLMQSGHQPDQEPTAMDYMKLIGGKRSFPAISSNSDAKRLKLASYDENDFVTFNARKLMNLSICYYLEQYFSQKLHPNAGYLISKLLAESKSSEASMSKDTLGDDADRSISLSSLCDKVDQNIHLPIDYSNMPNTPYPMSIKSEKPNFNAAFSSSKPSYLPGGEPNRIDQVKEYVLRLVQGSQGFLSIRAPATYVDSMIIEYHANKAKKFLKRILLENFVKERFGSNMFRIFRCIQIHRAVEEKHLSKLVMLDIRETREKLLILLSFGIIQLQDIPRSGDHHPQRTIYLWKYDDNFAEDYTLKNVLIKSYCNLYERMDFERASHALLLSKADDIAQNRSFHENSPSFSVLTPDRVPSINGKAAGFGSLQDETDKSDKESTDASSIPYTLSDNEKCQLRELYRKLDQLEWNALHLLPMLALFI